MNSNVPVTNYAVTMAAILNDTPAIGKETNCHEAAELFRKAPNLEGLAVVENELPIGLLSKNTLTLKLATQYGHAVYAKKSVTELMSITPLIVDIHENIDHVETLIAQGYADALSSGFIITEFGRYSGMGTALSLMKESVKRTHQQNKQLEKSTKLAHHSNHVKSQFLAGMSHELRTPLNAIIGFSELITQEAFGPINPPKYKQYVEDTLESGKHLLSMISDILDMSKIEAGRYDLNLQPVQLNNLTRNSYKMCQVLAEKKNIELTLSLSENQPVIIGDERAMKQIILNIVSNGIKYTPEGGKVDVKIVDRLSSGVQIIVQDNGPGIADEELQKVMEPFVQVKNSTTDKTEGTGLGLAIVNSLASLLGAHFNLESQLDEGTCATVTFPDAKRYKTKRAA